VSVGMSLVMNTTFAFERIASVYAGPKEIKSTGNSSKSSSKNRLLRGWLFQNGEASISSATPTLGNGLHLAYEEIESAKDRRPSKRTLRSP
jgi:hypothetical protein